MKPFTALTAATTALHHGFEVRAGVGLVWEPFVGIVHFVLWPWELRRGLPALTEAEGMTGERVPAYNRVLHAWNAASALALVLETPRGARRWALLGLAMGEPLRRSALHHFRWAREQARREPEKWSPLLRD